MKTSLCLFAITVCAVCAAAEERVVGLLGSPENFETIRQAERVEACPLIIDWKASTKGPVSSEGPYVALSESDASLFKTKLVASSSYLWGGGEKDCMPDYHLRARCYRGSRRVDVDFCFGCDVLEFHRGKEVYGHKDFDPVSKELFAVFLRLFPADPTMRLLAERREAWEKKRKKAANPAPAPTAPGGRGAP